LLNIFESGFVLYGVIIGGIAGVVIYSKIRKLNTLKNLNAFALILPITLFIIRFGCFITNDPCRGKPTNWFLAVIRYEGTKIVTQPHFAVPLYYMLNALILTGIVFYLYGKKNKYLFFWALLYYSITRFFIDFLRTDLLYWGLSANQWISLIIFLSIFSFHSLKRNQIFGR
jgi:phosphatidylglycerol:prolipoprotein diacylglycerol transferase